MRVEPFGPLVPMLSFKTFDEVVERANNNDLGLVAIYVLILWKKLIEDLN